MKDPDGRECVLVQGRGVQCDEHYAKSAQTLQALGDAAWNQGHYGEAIADAAVLSFDVFGRMGAAIEQLAADAAINPAGKWIEGMLTGNHQEAGEGGFALFAGFYAGWETKFAYGATVQRAGPEAANRALFERYKDSLRAEMGRPGVADPRLAELLDKLYGPGAEVGSGSTAAAVRNEFQTGMQVGDRWHW